MHLTAERLVFLLGSLFVSGVIVVANFAIRSFKGWYYTAGTDFLVAQMTFSFSSAILVKDMAPYIQHPYIREAANGIFVSLGLVIFLVWRSEEHTSELQSPDHLVCRLLLEKKKNQIHKKVTSVDDSTDVSEWTAL